MIHRKQQLAKDRKPSNKPLLKGREKPETARVLGYGRVSTLEQNLDLQISALKKAGVTDLYVEKLSAVNAKRPMFNLMMKAAERGDTVLFHSLSRLGRDLPQILAILRELNAEGVAWRSLTESHHDHTTASGKLMLNITGAMAQFERDQIVDRTVRGMSAARDRGMYLGRKPIVSNADARQMVKLRRAGVAVEKIARQFKCEPSTVYARTNALKRAKK